MTDGVWIFLSTVNVLFIASNFTNSHKSFLPDLDVLWPIEAATLLPSVIHHSFPLSLLDKHEDSERALLLRSGLVVELLRFSGCLSLRERLRRQNWTGPSGMCFLHMKTSCRSYCSVLVRCPSVNNSSDRTWLSSWWKGRVGLFPCCRDVWLEERLRPVKGFQR